MSFTVNGTTGITFPNNTTQNTAATGFGFKNRLINGLMQIDQRNAGASVTASDGAFVVDRWKMYHNSASGSKGNMQQNQGSVTPPSGFTNYIGFTTTSAYSVGSTDGYAFQQRIEGLNVGDLAWGTASASTVTLTFKVYSSLTGTFGGSLRNSAGDRSYPFSYTVSSANTWTSVSVTIAGDTTGTWLTTNGIGIYVSFSLGCGTSISGTAGAWASANYFSATGATSVVGTSGATFYITGVQLEKDSVATSFDYRPYGTELQLCMRYTQLMGDGMSGVGGSSTHVWFNGFYNQPMRTTPTASLSKTAIKVSDEVAADFTSSGSTIIDATYTSVGFRTAVNGFSGLTTYRSYPAFGNVSFLILSAEL